MGYNPKHNIRLGVKSRGRCSFAPVAPFFLLFWEEGFPFKLNQKRLPLLFPWKSSGHLSRCSFFSPPPPQTDSAQLEICRDQSRRLQDTRGSEKSGTSGGSSVGGCGQITAFEGVVFGPTCLSVVCRALPLIENRE